ncbi:MAG TPA: ATP-binding cassette domain-containing protein, partial [Geminicoccaceae bacterium]|nr:ATP-binding cassette domain-containing protein [Geminicoccaceae bacterium]
MAPRAGAQRRPGTRGYGLGAVEIVLSVDEVAREAAGLAAAGPPPERLRELAGGAPLLTIENLDAGYGRMQILHGFNLAVGKGQSLCLIGPNGAGKSTVLHSIYGFTTIMTGAIRI